MVLKKQLLVCTCPETPCDHPSPPPPPPKFPTPRYVDHPAARAARAAAKFVPQKVATASSSSDDPAAVAVTDFSASSPVVQDAVSETVNKPEKGKLRAADDHDGLLTGGDDEPTKVAEPANKPACHKDKLINGSNTNGGEDIVYIDVDPIDVSIKGSFTSGVVIAGGVCYNIEIEGCILRNVHITGTDLSSIKLFNTHLEDIEITSCELEQISCNQMEVKGRNFHGLTKDGEGQPYLGQSIPEALVPFDFVKIEWEKLVDIAAAMAGVVGPDFDPSPQQTSQQNIIEASLQQ